MLNFIKKLFKKKKQYTFEELQDFFKNSKEQMLENEKKYNKNFINIYIKRR